MADKLQDIPDGSREYLNERAKAVEIAFRDDEATKRLVMHSAKRVIAEHKAELEKLAFR